MLDETKQLIKTAFLLLIFFTLLLGIFYPLTITGLAQLFFPWKANGSLINENGKIVGSMLIGQSFTRPDYFWGRPSATTPFPYNAENSSGSNLGPFNKELLAEIKKRVEMLREPYKNNPLKFYEKIPIDLVTASASGLDPEISPQAAFYQIPRIAKARKIPEATLYALVEKYKKDRFLWVLGEPRINVLKLNRELDLNYPAHI